MHWIDGEWKLLERLQDIAALRHRVISANLANAEVPGYRAKEVRFREALSESLARGTLPDVDKACIVETEEPVSLEEEIGNLAKNTLLYRTWTRLLSLQLRSLRAAIGGR